MRRDTSFLVTTFVVALACAFFAATSNAPAASSPADRAQAKALRLTAAWLALYPSDLWVAAELPRRCTELSDRTRACPIAIVIRAWTAGALVPWRCEAFALIPPRGRDTRPHRTSASCAQVPA